MRPLRSPLGAWKRKTDPRAAAAGPGTERHGPAMAVGDLTHDGEPQPGARARCALDAVKPLEHERPFGFRNAGPVVLDFDVANAVAAAGTQRDHAALRRVSEGGVEEIGRRLDDHIEL